MKRKKTIMGERVPELIPRKNRKVRSVALWNSEEKLGVWKEGKKRQPEKVVL